ncbi:P-loop containing nucleoside triphosphate hydrolase protein [Aaosphaeria arxii CBS 175.79]|uniref:P-loop containing nucleoside triphosphate hydrolase protein n=1 Tax=Aaosphaeria arxii CBS 175.79 TaxID=1450172 RepID=A0A6A5XWS8_9PLEO|nr:P-loop containing nucleoside triphosphate hydrolase protein [Aaosphaeria arxii CBS 175.79]KAF2017100.1 P-loop containing nucleoside triphosphate hydrolase protein [Aaosphaeria arxii CBS 175.79]
MVECPLCQKQVHSNKINEHLDDGCSSYLVEGDAKDNIPASTSKPQNASHSFFTPGGARKASSSTPRSNALQTATQTVRRPKTPPASGKSSAGQSQTSPGATKRTLEDAEDGQINGEPPSSPPQPKRPKFTKTGVPLKNAPLAERMRPSSFDDVQGQELVDKNGIIRKMLETNSLQSMILWGDPGTGKTTIARIVASASGARYEEINSATHGLPDIRKIFQQAAGEAQLTGRKTVLFCDEIHRYKKDQQDIFLGPIETGQIILIGATTENPSFKVNNAILSRCRTFQLAKLNQNDIVSILRRALEEENCTSALLDTDMLMCFAACADGDARTALNFLSLGISLAEVPNMTSADIKKEMAKTLLYDRKGDKHYDNISALHKSIRGSDPHAAMFYLKRMLNSGEDPLYIGRRLIVVASEDIGLADNTMLPLATATYFACQHVGMPECQINLAHCVTALSLSPKSTRAYRAAMNVERALKEPGVAGLPVPIHLRNAPTRLMKEMGYGAEYKYNPDYVDGRVNQEYLPEELKDRQFLEDSDFGSKVDEDLEDMLLPEIDD